MTICYSYVELPEGVQFSGIFPINQPFLGYPHDYGNPHLIERNLVYCGSGLPARIVMFVETQ